MSEHKAEVFWERDTEDFEIKTFNRDHLVRFENGITLPGSSTPDFSGNPERVNPEDQFVAALSSCHMLTFLAVSALKGLKVESYTDHAVGFLGKNPSGRLSMNRVILRPRVHFSREHAPSREVQDEMHQKAHRGCFIANSVHSEVLVEPLWQ